MYDQLYPNCNLEWAAPPKLQFEKSAHSLTINFWGTLFSDKPSITVLHRQLQLQSFLGRHCKTNGHFAVSQSMMLGHWVALFKFICDFEDLCLYSLAARK